MGFCLSVCLSVWPHLSRLSSTCFLRGPAICHKGASPAVSSR